MIGSNLLTGLIRVTAVSVVASMVMAQAPVGGASSESSDTAIRAISIVNDPRMLSKPGPGGAVPNPAPPVVAAFLAIAPKG